ncbi:SRPBCC family protein [Mangrovihabitans endophyticus]|uniref:SRPBCC family protein n=1 Tax=Mangrovihabitans endophyticus TaxID=1751298 RepID=UPI0016634B4F|nr:SRPBCC family protein [Mangrovihabitans endophyticus]
MQLNASIVVEQDVTQVWDFLADPVASTPRWDRSVAEVIPRSPGPVDVGWEATTVSPSGKRQDFRVTAYEPGRELTFSLLSSLMFTRADLTFRLTGTPAGTRIDHVIDVELRSRLLGPVLRLVSKRALGVDLDLLRGALADFYGSAG